MNVFKATHFFLSILLIMSPRVFYIKFLFIILNSLGFLFWFFPFIQHKHLLCVRHCRKSCIIPKINLLLFNWNYFHMWSKFSVCTDFCGCQLYITILVNIAYKYRYNSINTQHLWNWLSVMYYFRHFI